MSKIAISLYIKNLIFDYATQFQYKHDSIPAVREFVITDAMYNDFINFLADKEFDYTLESEKLLNDLEEAIKKDKYTERLSEEITALRQSLTHDKNKDLMEFKGEISELLKEEIISRYYYQTGRAKAAIEEDPAVAKAVEVLNDTVMYKSLLLPN